MLAFEAVIMKIHDSSCTEHKTNSALGSYHATY